MAGISLGLINNTALFKKDWIGFSPLMHGQRYPNTFVRAMIMETSDHWPCVIEISTKILRSSIFRFENH